ncbi:glycogen debranching protein [Aquiflexum gelatinilyticum]|uniref:alpha-L-rhamnosidase-related protein n=1 Tax=Aquiflexum gelatinilyticum TaxID=2961943 RepID=UPI002168B971|nr:glycogen debranching protein [Aquiflexum gelatinilyticum]MCS4433807.1 glycogen debranching protein [Aquiflexum gelatinilyticum]
MNLRPLLFLFGLLPLFLFSCTSKTTEKPLFSQLNEVEGLIGKAEYLSSPYVTAGDRVYMVGHQDGTFPDLGWHVKGEMGGIWNHPIKLMDGFTAAIIEQDNSFCLDAAHQFINYPFANKHLFQTHIPGLEVERFQFVPEGVQGLVIEFTFRNVDKSDISFDFEFSGHTDLMPVWLGEKAGMVDFEDQLSFDESRQAWLGKDQGNEWYAMFGSNQKAIPSEGPSAVCNYEPQGKGKAAKLGYEINLKSESTQSIRFFISGSYTSKADAEETFDKLKLNAETYLKDKQKHYRQLASKAKITIPDKELEKAFEWIKYNTEWLVREVPEVGRGLGAGMPDYPWWFGVDNEYTLKGAIATGRKDLVYSTIELIHKLSETNGNGKIIHEVSSNGVIFNPGNINETPQFASLIWWVYQWTGDREFLATYYPTVKKGLQWLMDENDKDGNLFPVGYGMMEIHGLQSEMIDVASYTQKAFADAAHIASVMGEDSVSVSYQHTADLIKEKINKEFWVEEFNGYADFIGTPAEAIHLVEAAIIRADTLNKPWAVEELKATKRKLSTYPPNKKQGFVIFHNWVVNTPMEMGIADSDKAIRALEKGRKFTNPFGVFVTGIDRDESSEMADGTFVGSKAFSYTGAVMTLPTGVSAIGENNYGNPDQALDYLKRMTKSFGFALPGSIYEVSPDYGMMAQAWNLYSFGVPIVTQFFGIQPEAANKVIHISPAFPTDWKEAKIENVEIGDNAISFEYKVNELGQVEAYLSQEKEDWSIVFSWPASIHTNADLNGNKMEVENQKDKNRITFTGKGNKIRLY